MQHPGWLLIIVGLLIAVVGAVWMFSLAIPWLGKLPGDIVVERDNFHFYFPLMTSILLSLVLTGIIWLVRLFSR